MTHEEVDDLFFWCCLWFFDGDGGANGLFDMTAM